MAHKNRQARRQDFKQGKTIYYVDYRFKVIPMFVLGKPILRDGLPVRLPVKSGEHDYDGHLYLGDEGIPGFKYDDRPSTVFMSRNAAMRQIPSIKDYQKRWEESRADRHLDLSSSWDYPCEYSDTTEYEQVKSMIDNFNSNELKTIRIHEYEKKFRSDYVEFTTIVGDTRVFCHLIDSNTVRVNATISEDNKEYPECGRLAKQKYLLRVKGQWYWMDHDVESWLHYSDMKVTPDLSDPARSEWQQALEWITIRIKPDPDVIMD